LPGVVRFGDEEVNQQFFEGLAVVPA